MDVTSKANVWMNCQVYPLHVLNWIFEWLMDWFYQRFTFVVKIPMYYWLWFVPSSWDTGSLFDVVMELKNGVEVSLVGYFESGVLYGLNSMV